MKKIQYDYLAFLTQKLEKEVEAKALDKFKSLNNTVKKGTYAEISGYSGEWDNTVYEIDINDKNDKRLAYLKVGINEVLE